MAQSDLTIQNQSFPSFRSDLNDALTALNTTQSGTSRPSSAVAGTIWLDTTNATSPTLKLYDGGDDISLATLDYSANTVNWLDSSVVADLVNDTTPQLGGTLDTNGNNIQFDNDRGIADSNNNAVLTFNETASAVNEFTMTNSATGNNPTLSATGGDTNVGIDITTKGTGVIKFNDLAYYPEASLTSSSNAVAWDSQAAPNAKHVTTENTTFSAPSNATTGSFISLNIQYGGSHTIAFNTVFEFAASTAPTATSVSGQTDHFVFRYNGTVWQEMGRTLNMSAT